MNNASQKFPSPPPFRHIWATVFFLLQLFASLFISFQVVPAVFDHIQPTDQQELTTQDAIPQDRLMELFMLLITISTALIISILYHLVLKYLPKTMFWVTVILCNGFVIAYLVHSILRAYILGAVMAGVAWLVLLLVLFLCRERIPFDTLALSVVTSVVRAYPGMTWLSVLIALITSAWIVCFAFTVAGLLIRDLAPLIAFSALSFIYTLSVLRNVLRLACTRSFMVYFLLAASDRIVDEERGISWRGLFYASTYHFGSVCYASMFIGPVHLLFDWGTTQSMAWDARGFREKQSGCCAGLRATTLSKFNTYLWAHVAVMGRRSTRRPRTHGTRSRRAASTPSSAPR
jgi:hypothetical protein